VLNYTVTNLDEHSVTVARHGGPSTDSGHSLVVPTVVLVTFADGSTVLEPWDGEQAEMTFIYDDRPPVRSAQIDPEHKVVVDLRWADNGLSHRLEVSSWLALVTRLLYNLQNALLALGGL
jgi:hypothetical protein